jgi:hypothetical protein
VLDDNSTDGTCQIAERIAEQDSRVQVLTGKPLQKGWAGKVWACSQLGEAALEQGAEWLLFLDCDTRAQPTFLRTALSVAQNTDAGMVSTFPYQITGTLPEKIVLPMLHFLITTFLPVGMVWKSPIPGLVAACGQVELFSAEAYRAVGGHGSIPASFHDGLQLARRIKESGKIVRLYDGSGQISCRMYAGAREVWNGFTRNAYEGLGSVGALVTMTVLQGGLFLLPFLFLAGAGGGAINGGGFPQWGWMCLAQVGIILLIRTLQTRRFGHPEAILLTPFSVLALITIQWASYWKSLRKTQVAWKGRTYQ